MVLLLSGLGYSNWDDAHAANADDHKMPATGAWSSSDDTRGVHDSLFEGDVPPSVNIVVQHDSSESHPSSIERRRHGYEDAYPSIHGSARVWSNKLHLRKTLIRESPSQVRQCSTPRVGNLLIERTPVEVLIDRVVGALRACLHSIQ